MKIQATVKIVASIALLFCFVVRTAAKNPIPVPGAVGRLQYDYNAILHRNIGYNDFCHHSIAKDRLALKNNPNNAEAQEQLGCALYDSRWRLVRESLYTTPATPAVQEEAFTHLRKAAMLRPYQVDWQFSLGLFLNMSNRFQEAIPHLEKCLYLLRATKPFNNGQRKDSLTQDRLLFQHDPKAEMVLAGLGEALNRTGRRGAARAVWHKVILLCPKGAYYTHQARLKLAKYPAP